MVSRGWGDGCSEAKPPALPFRVRPGAWGEQLGRLGTAGGFCRHAEHGAAISMALFANLNSALRFEATETHLTRGGRTAEESQGGGGEVSREVSEARAVPCPCPHSPHPQRPASCCASAKERSRERGGGCRAILFVSFLLNCLPPPANPGTPGCRIFCKTMSLLTEPTVSYQLRCVSCSVSIQGGDGQMASQREPQLATLQSRDNEVRA